MAVPLIVFGLISINSNTNMIEEYTYQENHELVDALASDVDNILQSSENLLNVAAGAESLKTMNVDNMDEVLKEVVESSQYIVNVYVMDQSGMQVFKTTGELGSRSDRGYFQTAIKGEPTFSDVIISRSRGVPIVVHATPIERNGEVVGVLGASIDLGILSTLAAETKPGETGYGFIVDKEGRTIAHPDQEVVMENKDVSHLVPVKNAIQGNDGNALYSYQGDEKIYYYK